MTRKKAIQEMRGILLERRDSIRRALAGDLGELKEFKTPTPGDVVDAALDSVQDEISSQLVEVESRELGRIEHALEQMENGSFGACEACNSNIPLARLEALPYATYCINCQREAERQGYSSPADADWSRLADAPIHDIDAPIPQMQIDLS